MRKSIQYKEGRKAFKKGLSSADCPYPIIRKSSTQYRTHWIDGFYDEKFYQKYGSPWLSS
jgi:uncharacterized protein YaeQ|tara:strand:+ start:937 stop:1116 length:180 start_codon:yes stop_codon:yes gene_type:complete